MKNRNLFILMAAVLPLISCGTAGHSAFYGGSQFRNSVYYTPSNHEYAQVQQPEPEQVQTGSGQQYAYDVQSNTRTVHVGETNEVNINYEPGVTYVIADDEESYEARLRKFDSPTYNINIEFVEPSYWWNVHWGWYRPYGVAWRSAWYSPWWDRYYSWYGPSLFYWHDPWYTGPYWAWYNPWIDPWWGPVHRPGHHHPPHWPGYGPGHSHGRPVRDIYYGKRNTNSTYRDLGRGSVTTGSHNNVFGKPNTGSVTRRPSVGTTPPNGGNANTVVKGNSQQKEQQQYRRVTKSKSSGETNVKSSNGNSNRNSSYSRSSNSYNRSTSSYSNSSSRSSYGTSGGSGGSGGSRSSGGGSSYRRR